MTLSRVWSWKVKLEIVRNPNVEFPTNAWYRPPLQLISEILETVTYAGNARRNSHRPVLITRSEDSILKTLSWMSLAIMEWNTMSSNPSEGNSSSTGSSQADSRQPSGQSLFSWAANRSSSSGPQKIRVTILCARSLVKRDLFRLPDPFVKVHVNGSGQSHVTEAGKNTLDPKWNVHYDLYVGSNDAITISVWNDKKVGIKSFFYP